MPTNKTGFLKSQPNQGNSMLASSWPQISARKSAPFTFDAAMRRLTYLMGLGCLVVGIYGASLGPNPPTTVCVGLMIAFAAALGAGLVGFIFGVPFARDSAAPSSKIAGTPDRVEGDGNSSAYRPNTSLEQISDWLTKIIVGVGLVEIKEVPIALGRLVRYLAPGLGTGPQSEAFVASVLVFFAVSGFLFGFLWARLYLRRWLTDGDRDLIEKLSRFDSDARAYSLVARQLERREDETAVPLDELQDAIHSASSAAKARIFEQARAASEETDASDYHGIKNPAAATIFKALIADDAQARYHRNHGELGYTLDRQRPADLAGAISALSEAIERRDKLRKTGWRYYEFRRALKRIRQDPNFNAGKPSDAGAVTLIVADINAAKIGDPTKSERWLRESPDVTKWLQLNNIQI